MFRVYRLAFRVLVFVFKCRFQFPGEMLVAD